MDASFCSSALPLSLCYLQTLFWSFPLLYLFLLLLYRLSSPRIHLHRNRNVNAAALMQYLLILTLPLIDLTWVFIKPSFSVSEFLQHLGFLFNAILCSAIMRMEFPRILRPGVYSGTMRCYFLLIIIVAAADFVLPFIMIGLKPEGLEEIGALLLDSLRILLLCALNVIASYSVWSTKSLHLQPLLFEDPHSPPLIAASIEKMKDEEEDDEYKLTRSSSVMTAPPDLGMLKSDLLESRSNSRSKSIYMNIDIPKVLVSHDSSSEIIVLYEIRVQDHKGKQLRTIYRRFSEFETLHSQLKEETKGQKIEGFPQKSLLFSISGKDNQDLIDHRKKALTSYLQGLAMNEALMATKTMRDFLAITEI